MLFLPPKPFLETSVSHEVEVYSFTKSVTKYGFWRLTVTYMELVKLWNPKNASVFLVPFLEEAYSRLLVERSKFRGKFYFSKVILRIYKVKINRTKLFNYTAMKKKIGESLWKINHRWINSELLIYQLVVTWCFYFNDCVNLDAELLFWRTC